MNVLGRGIFHRLGGWLFGGGLVLFWVGFFLPWYNYLNEFSFADRHMNNCGAALQIKNLYPVSNSEPTETCLVGCLKRKNKPPLYKNNSHVEFVHNPAFPIVVYGKLPGNTVHSKHFSLPKPNQCSADCWHIGHWCRYFQVMSSLLLQLTDEELALKLAKVNFTLLRSSKLKGSDHFLKLVIDVGLMVSLTSLAGRLQTIHICVKSLVSLYLIRMEEAVKHLGQNRE